MSRREARPEGSKRQPSAGDNMKRYFLQLCLVAYSCLIMNAWLFGLCFFAYFGRFFANYFMHHSNINALHGC